MKRLSKIIFFVPKLILRIYAQQISLWTIAPLFAIARSGWDFWWQTVGFCFVFLVDDIIKFWFRRRAERKEMMRIIERARLHRPNLAEARRHRE